MKELTILLTLLIGASIHGLQREVLEFLHNYNRDFSLLFLGDNAIDRGIEVADLFSNAIAVVITNNHLHREIKTSNVSVLSFKLSEEQLAIMRDCEHFDVIFLTNPGIYKDITKIAMQMADYIIMEDTKNTVKKTNNENLLEKRTLVWPPPVIYRPKIYKIVSTFETKILHKSFEHAPEQITESSWFPGINLLTFLFFNGVYPPKKNIKEQVGDLANSQFFRAHNDPSPANLILAGTKLLPIDVSQIKLFEQDIFERKIDFIYRILDQPYALQLDVFRNHYWVLANQSTSTIAYQDKNLSQNSIVN